MLAELDPKTLTSPEASAAALAIAAELSIPEEHRVYSAGVQIIKGGQVRAILIDARVRPTSFVETITINPPEGQTP